MPTAFDRILGDAPVDLRPRCSPDHLTRLAEQLSAPVPESVAEFWRVSNGCAFTDHSANILGTHEVSELLLTDGIGDWLRNTGLLPVLYDQESNYLCCAIGAPLNHRFIYLLHDDSPKLLYRDGATFFDGCARLLESSDFAALYFHETNGDHGPDTSRTGDDLTAAKTLLDSSEDWAIPIAIQLLDSSSVSEWNALLNGDRFARQDALRRLHCMSSGNATAILENDAQQFDSFATEVCSALENEAIPFERRDSAVKIDQRWMDLNAFFGRRHIDDAIPRLLAWFRDVRDGKTPTERTGNYMAD